MTVTTPEACNYESLYVSQLLSTPNMTESVAAPRGGLGRTRPTPVLFKVNFLICPNPVRKMGGGGGVRL